MPARFVAVLDIGKTNVKLVLHDLETSEDRFVRTRPNTVLAGPPYPHFDVEGLFAFFLEALDLCARQHPVDAIAVTTHGASAALVRADGTLALPVLDYESDLPDALRAEYDAIRPPFSETFSPRLPGGLNIGAQLFFQETRFARAFAEARFILPYPQYWAMRLCGVEASEITSLGCHSDLLAPATGTLSSLAVRRGWDRKIPPLRSAFDALGALKPELAARIDLPGRAIPVHCGIHDSNASLLPHVLSREAPFSVVSTGTWTILFAVGGGHRTLDPARDMLANVDALGRPVPSARFMGGREFDLLSEGRPEAPQDSEIARVLTEGVMALPSFAAGTGPFPNRAGGWTTPPETLSPGERTAAASLYVALMLDEILTATGAAGPTVIEGPLARNALFLDALAILTGRTVEAAGSGSGTSAGAALLARGPTTGPASTLSSDGAAAAGSKRLAGAMRRYARLWRLRIEERE